MLQGSVQPAGHGRRAMTRARCPRGSELRRSRRDEQQQLQQQEQQLQLQLQLQQPSARVAAAGEAWKPAEAARALPRPARLSASMPRRTCLGGGC